MQKEDKVFIRDCALYVKGELKEIKLKGDPRVVRLFADVLSESRKFYLALQSGELKDVIPLLERKRRASRLLRYKTGYVWPL
jgi:hypothetical protein